MEMPYSGIAAIQHRPLPDQPGTPHSFFETSYTVEFTPTEEGSATEVVVATSQILHQHPNGLCIVTAGDALKPFLSKEAEIAKVEFCSSQADGVEVTGGKRKKKRKMEKKISAGGQGPSDALALVTLTDGRTIQLNRCVLGDVLELNHRLADPLNSSLLLTDPLLDGYIAIIVPKGPFPPRHMKDVGKD
eukprot:scaffold296631_cov48-Attheya_sp.AAC.1